MPGNYQQLLVNMEVKRGETLGSLNELFRRMAQLKEELEVVEQQIQVGRGVMDGLEQAQEIIKTQIKADQIADFQEQKTKENVAKEKEAQEIIAKRKESAIPFPRIAFTRKTNIVRRNIVFNRNFPNFPIPLSNSAGGSVAPSIFAVFPNSVFLPVETTIPFPDP